MRFFNSAELFNGLGQVALGLFYGVERRFGVPPSFGQPALGALQALLSFGERLSSLFFLGLTAEDAAKQRSLIFSLDSLQFLLGYLDSGISLSEILFGRRELVTRVFQRGLQRLHLFLLGFNFSLCSAQRLGCFRYVSSGGLGFFLSLGRLHLSCSQVRGGICNLCRLLVVLMHTGILLHASSSFGNLVSGTLDIASHGPHLALSFLVGRFSRGLVMNAVVGFVKLVCNRGVLVTRRLIQLFRRSQGAGGALSA